eukprot:9568234-Alexandrium_andersonii.AAC.1
MSVVSPRYPRRSSPEVLACRGLSCCASVGCSPRYPRHSRPEVHACRGMSSVGPLRAVGSAHGGKLTTCMQVAGRVGEATKPGPNARR